MTVASLELCKELYELSHWTLTEKHWYQGKPIYNSPWGWDCSAYDLGFLLEKLPKYHKVGKTAYCLDLRPRMLLDGTHYHSWWCGLWYEHGGGARGLAVGEADTPEDAACKLAIELFKQGVL
jgi:hypothetical protein